MPTSIIFEIIGDIDDLKDYLILSEIVSDFRYSQFSTIFQKYYLVD